MTVQLSEFAQYLSERQMAYSTKCTYLKVAGQLFADCPAENLNKLGALAFISQIEKIKNRTLTRVELAVITQLCRSSGIPFRPKFDNAEARTTRPDPLTQDELNKFMSGIFDRKWTALVQLMLATGLKPSEIVKVDVRQVSIKNSSVELEITRRNRPVTLPVNEECSSALFAWLNERPLWLPETPAIFINRRGERLSMHGVESCLVAISSSVGIKLSAKRLRDTWISHQIVTGKPFSAIAEMSATPKTALRKRIIMMAHPANLDSLAEYVRAK